MHASISNFFLARCGRVSTRLDPLLEAAIDFVHL